MQEYTGLGKFPHKTEPFSMNSPSRSRARLSSDLEAFRPLLLDVLGALDADPEWYASVFFERKASQTYGANLKQTQLSDSVSSGAVLRIYDGYTLFEQATDQTDAEFLLKEAKELVARVRKAQAAAKTTGANPVKRPYRAPTWAERLSPKNETGASIQLDPELVSQIPADATAKTPVHFGIAFERDPTVLSTEARIANLKRVLERVKALAPKAGLTEKDLSYVMAREGLSIEESLFVDRESNLSQTIYRVSMTVIVMSGAERAANRFGGLGGAEAIEVSDEKILEMLEDVKALKEADRLKPGKYQLLLGPTLSGVLAHEAFGHSQEGDTCARGRSKAWDLHQEGVLVGNDQATILNSPAVYENGVEKSAAWGSYFFDEEGWLAQEQVLLDRGVLKAPMTNLTSALRLGIPRSSNGKRESWQNGVYTRQTNTYFSPGDKTFDELLAMIDYGFVATNAAGGMEDPKGMGIQVGLQYLKEVKNGKYTGRVFKGPAGGDIQLTGYVPDVLNSIVAKSKIEATSKEKDQAKHPYNDCGGCGKYHKEIVYAGCGGPYMLLKDQILG
jgi:TldD protein